MDDYLKAHFSVTMSLKISGKQILYAPKTIIKWIELYFFFGIDSLLVVNFYLCSVVLSYTSWICWPAAVTLGTWRRVCINCSRLCWKRVIHSFETCISHECINSFLQRMTCGEQKDKMCISAKWMNCVHKSRRQTSELTLILEKMVFRYSSTYLGHILH